MNTLLNRYHIAIEKIGGTFALMALPEQVKTALMNCNDLETKVKMLELIVKQIEKNKDAIC